MAELPGRMRIILLFLIGGILIMFADGLVYDNYNTKVSMATMHHEMKPVVYADPAPPSLEEYWTEFRLMPTVPARMDDELAYETVVEDGVPIKVFHLTMQNSLHEFRPGVKMPIFTFDNRFPSPTMRLKEGDRVRLVLFNNGTEIHSIHWHGINNITNAMDGVPDVTQEGVPPGGSFTYEFTAGPSGTKIYHCHVEAPHHITMGMFGALIVEPADKDEGDPFDRPPDREYVQIYSEFDTAHAHMALPGDMMPMGPDGELPWLISPGRKFMMPFMPEFNEFLINGKSFPSTDPIRVKEGDIVRLRLINLGLEPMSIHIHGHEFTVTHRDGFLLPAPFKVDTLMIGPAERYDVWFEANNPGIWMLHEHGGKNMANGYDPAGIMTAIVYEGYTDDVFEAFLKRTEVYQENIEHMDDEHGRLTPSTPVGGAHEMDAMAGMGGH